MAQKGILKDPPGGVNIFYLDCDHVSILVVTL